MVGRPRCTCPSIHVETLKITVSCRPCTYPRIHLPPDEDTLKITVGCLASAYPSIHQLTTLKLSRSLSVARRAHIQAFAQKLADVLDSMVHAGNTRAVGTSTRADACACAGDPQPRACLNLHHPDIQGTAQKSPCVNTFLRPSRKKRRPSRHCLGAWAGDTEQRHTGNGHVRQQRDTTHGTTDT